jgi:hypothetical protein
VCVCVCCNCSAVATVTAGVTTQSSAPHRMLAAVPAARARDVRYCATGVNDEAVVAGWGAYGQLCREIPDYANGQQGVWARQQQLVGWWRCWWCRSRPAVRACSSRHTLIGLASHRMRTPHELPQRPKMRRSAINCVHVPRSHVPPQAAATRHGLHFSLRRVPHSRHSQPAAAAAARTS